MKDDKKGNGKVGKIIMIISLVVLSLLVLALSIAVYELSLPVEEKAYNYARFVPNSEADIINGCADLTISETAACYTDYISTIYKYNITNQHIYTYGKNLFFADIKQNGGDCGVYSDLYKSMAENMGFMAQEITIAIGANANFAHKVIIISDTTGYCLISFTNYYCAEFGIDKSVEEQFKKIYGKDMVLNDTG